jgi:flagellar hook assembly protein FlgD
MDLENASDVEVEIYNATGQLVNRMQGNQPAGISELKWNATNATPGWYFARVKTSSTETTLKILKQE